MMMSICWQTIHKGPLGQMSNPNYIMPVENGPRPLSQTEEAELVNHYPRTAWWIGSALRHPDLHREHSESSESNNVENLAPHGT